MSKLKVYRCTNPIYAKHWSPYGERNVVIRVGTIWVVYHHELHTHYDTFFKPSKEQLKNCFIEVDESEWWNNYDAIHSKLPYEEVK